MSRKTKAAYKRALEIVKEHEPAFNIKMAMTDFEKALFTAVLAVFPHAAITGCLFHVDQVRLADPVVLLPTVCLKFPLLIASFSQNTVHGTVVRDNRAADRLP
jgi:hypothetical protein